MIRVLHLLGTAGVGGVETFVETLARNIDRSRFALSVCVLGEHGPLSKRLKQAGCEVVAVGSGPQALIRFATYVRRGKFDILHANTGGRRFRSVAAGLGLQRIIVHLHGPDGRWSMQSNSPGLQKRMKAIAAHATITVVCARWLGRLFQQNFAAKDVRVVQYGVELPPDPTRSSGPSLSRASFGISERAVVIGFVGRLIEQKGIVDLAQCISKVLRVRADVCFLVIGDGPLRTKLDEFNGNVNVIFTGAVDEAVSMLHLVDIVVMPSHWEGLSIAHLQAMAAAKPVVGYAIDGLTESAEPGTTGLYVRPGDATAFTEALTALIDAPDTRRRMGDAARAKIAREYRADRMTRDMEEVYEGTIGDITPR